MILRLAVEQARSQKRYTLWTAAFMTLALALVTFALIVAATQNEVDSMQERLGTPIGESGAQVYSLVDDVPSARVLDLGPGDLVPIPEIDARLEAALATGPGATATRWTFVTIGDPADVEGSAVDLAIHAVAGTYDWDLALGAGAPPGPGEIVVSAAFAEQHDLGIGDTVTVLSMSWNGTSDQPTVLEQKRLTISGLARSGNSYYGGYSAWAPEAYASWEDSSDPDGLFYMNWMNRADEDHGTVRGVETIFSWTGDRPTLASLPGSELFQVSQGWSTGPPTSAYIAWGFAMLVLLGMITMSFSVGRSQAQVRLQWLATARTLGASRRTLSAAAAVETLIVGAVAVVGGFLLGLGAAAVHLRLARSLVPLPLLPETVAVPLWVPVSTAAAGLVMAGVVAAIPAFWAARVSPVAALKPVTDVSQAEVSRRVSALILVPLFGLALVAFAVDPGIGSVGEVSRVLGGIVGLVTGYMLLLESTRGVVPVLGRWLGRRRAPWALAAGDALMARPRQAVAPAFLLALAFTVFTATVVDANLWSFEFVAYGPEDPNMPIYQDFMPTGLTHLGSGAAASVIAVLMVLQLAALGAALAGERSVTADAATRQALGLSSRDSRIARAVVHGLPQVAGVILGVLAGFALAMYLHFAPADTLFDTRPPTSGDFFYALRMAAHSVWFAVGAAVVIIAVGSILLAAGKRRASPVQALRPDGGGMAR